MMLGDLKQNRIFYYFEQISSIPHGSGNTKAVSDYCASVAEKLGLCYRQDELNNIIIYKNGSVGREGEQPIILQGHLDMVCEKDPEKTFDFSKDGLQLKVEGDILSADGTTLGADDGIAVAMGLALLEEKDLSHPPLEVLFTVDEETGMFGAAGLSTDWLKGKQLINIDSEEEGVLTVGCAGGARADISIELIPTAVSAPCYKVVIDGLAGGHSGVEIHKGRYNANKVMGEFLLQFDDLCLIELAGGQKDNVIPSYCEAIISTEGNPQALTNAFVAERQNEANPDLCVTVTPIEPQMMGYDSFSSRAAVNMLCRLPDGVQQWSPDIDGLVQTSLNLGIMKLENDALHLSFALRSSLGSEKEELLRRLAFISTKYGAEFSVGAQYPAWEFVKNSPLREKMIAVFERQYGITPKIEIIHAGLECGLLSEKIKGMDAVSIGPQMWDIHSPRERLSISSAERTYEYVKQVLKEI